MPPTCYPSGVINKNDSVTEEAGVPISESSRLKLARLLLTKEQVNEIERLAVERSTDIRRVSLSEAAREVVSVGLDAISPAVDSDLDTSAETAVA